MTKKAAKKAVFVTGSDGYTRVQVNGKPNASVLAYRAPTFAEFLRGKGLTEKAVKGDGNCFYRSVAEQVYGDELRKAFNEELEGKFQMSPAYDGVHYNPAVPIKAPSGGPPS